MEAEIYGNMLSAKIVIRDNAPPENMLNIPKIPPECLAKTSDNTLASIPGRGMNVPKRNTIKAKIVNHNLLLSSSALLNADISIPAAIFSANDTIFSSLSI